MHLDLSQQPAQGVNLLRFINPFRRKKSVSTRLTLDKPRAGFWEPIKTFFQQPFSIENFQTLEETLLSADVGVATTQEILAEVQSGNAALKEKLISLVQSAEFVWPRLMPALILIAGVNGTGKTTSVGKLAHQARMRGLKTLVVAGDTFRSAAPEQLAIWAERAGAQFYRGAEGADPASVIFSAIEKAKAQGIDLILADTAGRMHTTAPLMDELTKIVRVAEKGLGRKPDEIFLVLDATTGQNGLSQARQFLAAVPVTGIILTKYDGTAKGGILLSVVHETGLPLRFIGVGEGIDDLQIFNAEEFVGKLLN